MKKYLITMLSTLLVLLSGSIAFADTQFSNFSEEDLENQRIIDSKPLCTLDKEGNVIEPQYDTDATAERASGSYPNADKNKGTILYTKDTTLQIASVVGHAAIVYSAAKVVESDAGGVSWGRNNWYRKSHCRAGIVKKLSAAKRKSAANKCKSWRGKPYNWNFWNTKTRAKFYCSHLVYAGYIDTSGYNLNPNGGIVFPSELLANDGISIIYKKG